MYKEKQRIIAMVNELLNFLLYNGVSSINITIEDEQKETKIIVRCRVTNVDLLEVLGKSMEIKRSEELETLYWGLLGDQQPRKELKLIGSMVDVFKIQYLNDELVEMTLIRRI